MIWQIIRRFWLVPALLLLGTRSTLGFALIGPLTTPAQPDGWQTITISYQVGGDIGTPKNLGEGFRYNVRNLFWACDENFQNFFGSNGVAAVEQAMGIINSLTNVSSYSSDLSEWPLNTTRVNHRADALGLIDLRTVVLQAMSEQLGLAEPDRWTWTLRTRQIAATPPGCPIGMVYGVIQRNFDPVTFEPSSYVNGALYSYEIVEVCQPGPQLADAVEVTVAPTGELLTAAAARAVASGSFMTGLTRDDVGGLRYLWATNRIYTEAAEPGSLLVDSNNATFSLIVTSNLAQLPFGPTTNTAAQLLALFPGLQIIPGGTPFPFFTNVVTTNFIATPTNCLGCPAGSPPILVLVPVITTNIVQLFQFTYGNIVTVSTNNSATVVITTTNVQNSLQPGVLVTNVSTQSYQTNIPGGEFFLVPANQCGFSILATQLTSVVLITNTVSTNVAGFTNVGQGISVVTVFTNHTLVVSVPACIANSLSLREGIEKVRIFRRDFDSLTGEAWLPITNTYTLTAVTNNHEVTQTLYRVVTQPDFLFTATDQGLNLVLRNVGFDNTGAGTGLAGPGILLPASAPLNFSKTGPIFQNPSIINVGAVIGAFLPPFNESTHALLFHWGSFDGRTNEPIAYPSGTSVLSLENNVFLQITVSGPLPVGHVGVPYSFQIPATGAQPAPYTWSLVSLFPGQPPPSVPAPGLTLNTSTGLISGTPTTPGLYDFVVQVADSAGRVNRTTLEIEIDP